MKLENPYESQVLRTIPCWVEEKWSLLRANGLSASAKCQTSPDIQVSSLDFYVGNYNFEHATMNPLYHRYLQTQKVGREPYGSFGGWFSWSKKKK